MSKSFTLGQLTEGIRDRNVGQDGGRLINKWTRTGLLRGLQETKRETMARLLENQAAQVLREANTLGSQGSGSVEGFSNIAFPIVRRVFGGLVANELVSIQPMSLPSGLLFYLDYSYGTDVGHTASGDGNAADQSTDLANVYDKGGSLYGNPSGRSVRTGADAVGGMYDLAGSAYSKVYKTIHLATGDLADAADSFFSYDSSGNHDDDSGVSAANSNNSVAKNLKLLQYDPQLLKEIAEEGLVVSFLVMTIGTNITSAIDKTLIKGAGLMVHGGTLAPGAQNGLEVWANDSAGNKFQSGQGLFNLKRLTQVGTWSDSNDTWTPDATGSDILFVMKGAADGTAHGTTIDLFEMTYPLTDELSQPGGSGEGTTLTVPSFESNFNSTGTPIIPEIDIKIESIAVTAQTRKLRARWSPELAQDLNAYHSMDAEVELTQILSEQIALEIDREILNDLLVEAKGANFFWSRAPGKFVNKRTGTAQNLASTLATGPQFTGTVREWYETLVETIIDVANEIHRKTLRGAANFIVVSPEVATVFEASVLYKPSIKIDGQGQVAQPFSLGAEAIGSLSNRFTVYKDPYFPRNKILVGYKGGSYLESGYVYAPYVPLIVTPTIFAPEDFTPRKGVMTRYGKKMVRADFYGTVTCLDMDII